MGNALDKGGLRSARLLSALIQDTAAEQRSGWAALGVALRSCGSCLEAQMLEGASVRSLGSLKKTTRETGDGVLRRASDDT